MKITEKELYERIMALREKMYIVEAEYAAGDTASQALLDKAASDKAARAQATPSWWDKLTGTMATAPEQASPVKDKARTEKGGTGYVQPSTTTATTPPPVAGFKSTTGKSFNWNDRNAIIAFQKANVGLDGKPLKVDGLIGAQTMQAMAKQGIQPPPGFKMAGSKPVTHTQKTATPPVKQDPEVLKIQQELNARGYKVALTGVMDSATQAAREQSMSSGDVNRGLQDIINTTAKKTASPATIPNANSEVPTTNYNTSLTGTNEDNSTIREQVSFGNMSELARIITLSRH